MKISIFSFVLFWLLSCSEGQTPQFPGLPYDLSKPEKMIMPNVLEEISGIAFGQNSDTIYAVQDEDGVFFSYIPRSNGLVQTKFGKKGDYEDLTIFNGTVYMLKSNGAIYSFPLPGSGEGKADDVLEFKLLPEGEYEGLYADNATGRIYVLCKHCSSRKNGGSSGYILSITAANNLELAGTFDLDKDEIEASANYKKGNFHPSALSMNTKTKEWYILSSVNRVLVVTDTAWKIKQVYPLDTDVFVQPEGIAFDDQQNLYISNEAGVTSNGNILKFSHHP